MQKEAVQLAGTNILEVCAVNTGALRKLCTPEFPCTVHNPGQKHTFQKMWGEKYDFASATQGALLPEWNTKVEASQSSLQFQRWMFFLFLFVLTQFKIPGSERQRMQVPLWLSLSAWDTNSLFYRTDRSVLYEASLCSGSVWLSSVARRRFRTGPVTHTFISPRNIRKAMHLEKCLKY